MTGVSQYRDVAKTSEFYDAILWAKAKGIVTGYGNNIFAPNQAVTRGQAVSMIWRYVGSPAPKGNKKFSDTPAANHLFYNAIKWAAENDIATGYAGYMFRMNDGCTRGQMIRFIYNAVK